MPTLKGRRFFFATRADLTSGLRAAEQTEAVEYVPLEMRPDEHIAPIRSLSEHAGLGQTTGSDVNTSPSYLIFRRGEIPAPRKFSQQDGGVRYGIDPTPDCLILRCGGLHERLATISIRSPREYDLAAPTDADQGDA